MGAFGGASETSSAVGLTQEASRCGATGPWSAQFAAVAPPRVPDVAKHMLVLRILARSEWRKMTRRESYIFFGAGE